MSRWVIGQSPHRWASLQRRVQWASGDRWSYWAAVRPPQATWLPSSNLEEAKQRLWFLSLYTHPISTSSLEPWVSMSDVFRSPLQIHFPCSSTQLCTQKLDHVDHIHELPCPPVSSQSQPWEALAGKQKMSVGNYDLHWLASVTMHWLYPHFVSSTFIKSPKAPNWRVPDSLPGPSPCSTRLGAEKSQHSDCLRPLTASSCLFADSYSDFRMTELCRSSNKLQEFGEERLLGDVCSSPSLKGPSWSASPHLQPHWSPCCSWTLRCNL